MPSGADTVDKESVFANYKSVFSRQFAVSLAVEFLGVMFFQILGGATETGRVAGVVVAGRGTSDPKLAPFVNGFALAVDQFLSNEERLALKLATLQQFHEEIVEEAAQSQQEHDNMLRKVEQRKIQAALKQAVEPDFMCPILHERMKVP
ncbi:SPAC977.17, partial [Symbiodinium sp. KB8]